MIVAFALILLAQLAGEAIARVIAVPVPGPVIGMGLLIGFLALRDAGTRANAVLPRPLRDGTLEATCMGLLAHLSLMFVPAGVGIVGRLDVLAAHGTKLAIVLLLSVIVALAATALTFVAVARLTASPSSSSEDERR